MKHLLTLVLCLGALFTLGKSFKGTEEEPAQSFVAAMKSEDDFTDVRVGGEDEGIHLLTAVFGK